MREKLFFILLLSLLVVLTIQKTDTKTRLIKHYLEKKAKSNIEAKEKAKAEPKEKAKTEPKEKAKAGVKEKAKAGVKEKAKAGINGFSSIQNVVISGESWQNSKACNEKNSKFKCICTKGCEHLESESNTKKDEEECFCFDNRQCYQFDENDGIWVQTKEDSYEKEENKKGGQCAEQK